MGEKEKRSGDGERISRNDDEYESQRQLLLPLASGGGGAFEENAKAKEKL